MSGRCADHPEGHCFFMSALLLRFYPPKEIVCVLSEPEDLEKTRGALPKDALVRVLPGPAEAYPLKDGRTTFYVCENGVCLPPVNEM